MKTPRFLSALALCAALGLLAPAALAQDTTQAAEPEMPPAAEEEAVGSDVVSLLAADGSFTVLVDALEKTGLAETLQNEGPFTVFAPTDDAFAALPEGTLDALTAEELAEVLRYHVVPGTVVLEDAVAAGSAVTVQGDALMIASDNSGTMVENASILSADVEASNGVIHAIDAVLMPSGTDDAEEGEEEEEEGR